MGESITLYRSRRAAGLACAALLGAALTGCSQHHATTDPAKALTTALAGVDAGRYSFDITFPGGHFAGSVDKAGHQAQWTDTVDDQPGRIVYQTRVIGTDMFTTNSRNGGLGSDMKPLPVGVWEHFDLALESPDEDPLTDPDVVALHSLFATVTATSADGGTVHGTMNLASFRPRTPDLADLVSWAGAGPIPVTTRLDDRGRLTTLTADLPAGGSGKTAGPMAITISAYGQEVTPAPRPARTGEAPPVVYQ